jgi:hypothetical protein
MQFKFDPSTFDALGRLAESFDKHLAGGVLVCVLVVAMILASGAAIAIARRSSRHRRRAPR